MSSGRSIAEDERQVGVATRAVSWLLDAAVINLVAIAVGVGIGLIVSIFPISPSLSSVFKPIAAAVYGIWVAGYFIVFWSVTGQTPGARVMQIRMVTADRKQLGAGRATVRWVGMNLAMLPLFAGYLPILFRRRGFPDWLAHTLVLDAAQVSLAQLRRDARRAARTARMSRPVSSQATAADPARGTPGGPNGVASDPAPLSPSEILDPGQASLSFASIRLKGAVRAK